METPSSKRQAWLEQATRNLRPKFQKAGYEVSKELRVSIGWPRGRHGKKAIGQCWDKSASTDGHNEIFLSPALLDSELILGTLVHEMVHAAVGTACGHKGPFKQCAVAMGLEGKMTATTSGPVLAAWCADYVKDHGPYPGGALNERALKKQSTRLIKCECGECGYIARVSQKVIDDKGEPFCGIKSHGRMSTDN